METFSVGSVCSGIEAASVAWAPLKFSFEWFSEIADFPSKVLSENHPNAINYGDLNNLPQLIRSQKISSPDLICAGTPCQAFSLAGWQNGLGDERGGLTLKFLDIVSANDEVRKLQNKSSSVVFWENVEGVLRDKTNAFGCFVSSLAGLNEALNVIRWPDSGLIIGPKRKVAWRVLDAKHFGTPQQRRRVFVLAGDINFNPENVLFELSSSNSFQKLEQNSDYSNNNLIFYKDGIKFQTFREYTDCLYTAYGTKWNGNAAALNGSLFLSQNDRLRRFSPLECERLMGFPDNYTNIDGSKNTPRYQALGNSWAVPVVHWIGARLSKLNTLDKIFENDDDWKSQLIKSNNDYKLYNFDKFIGSADRVLNTSSKPLIPKIGDMKNIVDPNASEKLYLSPVGCKGILRRKAERKANINPELEKLLIKISNQMSESEIEKISRKQRRGKLSEISSYVSSQFALNID